MVARIGADIFRVEAYFRMRALDPKVDAGSADNTETDDVSLHFYVASAVAAGGRKGGGGGRLPRLVVGEERHMARRIPMTIFLRARRQ